MGDGRHRQDPRGHSRYLIASLGIVIVLALLGTGGYALYSVLTADSDQGDRSAAAASTTSPTAPAQRASVTRRPVSSPGATDPASAPPTLTLQVIDSPCFVSISLPGGRTLLNETLRRGDTVHFDKPELEVIVGDPEAVRVTVNGRLRDPGRPGIDTFTVSRKG